MLALLRVACVYRCVDVVGLPDCRRDTLSHVGTVVRPWATCPLHAAQGLFGALPSAGVQAHHAYAARRDTEVSGHAFVGQ